VLIAFLSVSNVVLNNWWSLHRNHPQVRTGGSNVAELARRNERRERRCAGFFFLCSQARKPAAGSYRTVFAPRSGFTLRAKRGTSHPTTSEPAGEEFLLTLLGSLSVHSAHHLVSPLQLASPVSSARFSETFSNTTSSKPSRSWAASSFW
jgi:hypothetical protein